MHLNCTMHDQSEYDSADGQSRCLQKNEYIVPKWPKIELTSAFKEDIRKAFMMFDENGEGTVTVDAVKVAFRALGYNTKASEFNQLRQQLKDVGGRVDFGEFLNLLTDRMLALDDDVDIAKSFELMDTGNKGYINLEDLRKAAETLELSEVYDDDFAAMLLGAQISNLAAELQKSFEEHQKQARIRNGLSYGVGVSGAEAVVASASPGDVAVLSGVAGYKRTRRLSSSGQPNPESLTVNLEQFTHLMKITRPPVEDIRLL
ncbi:unnamed protein product [Dicrocoelium dendriticum]|nr:unnamed protein product [Dicrocoelium dendriticum]